MNYQNNMKKIDIQAGDIFKGNWDNWFVLVTKVEYDTSSNLIRVTVEGVPSPEKEVSISYSRFRKNFTKVIQSNKFAQVVNLGYSYSSHPDSKKMGMTRYHYLEQKDKAKSGGIYKVVSFTELTDEPAYVLEDPEGIQYLIGRSGVIEVGNGKMDSELIGYELIKPEYKKAALQLTGYTDFSHNIGYDVKVGSPGENYLRKADVLDKWFTPVYQFTELENIEEALVQKAKTLGYNNFIFLPSQKVIPTSFDFIYNTKHNTLFLDRYKIYEAGKWHAFVKLPSFKVNGYKVEYYPEYIVIGCKKLTYEEVHDFLKLFVKIQTILKDPQYKEYVELYEFLQRYIHYLVPETN